MIEFKLPSLGAEMDAGTLLEWRVKAGDSVKKGDIVAVVDTSKSAIDVEIWQEGTVYELAMEVGEKVPVGTVIVRLLEPGETPEQAQARIAEAASAAKAAPASATAAMRTGIPAPPPAAPGARQAVSPAARARART